MKILYVHHAERDRLNKSVERQFQDITESTPINIVLSIGTLNGNSGY